jgi:hypothetical protein
VCKGYRRTPLFTGIGSVAALLGTLYLCYAVSAQISPKPASSREVAKVDQLAPEVNDSSTPLELSFQNAVDAMKKSQDLAGLKQAERVKNVERRREWRLPKKRDTAEDGDDAAPWRIVPDAAPARKNVAASVEKAPAIAFRDHLIYSTFPHSSVVGFAPPGRDNNRLEFCDLRQMRRIGAGIRLEGRLIDYRHLVLSPDGSFLAGVARADGSSASVWSTATGRNVRRITVDENPKMKLGMVDFAGEGRLLTMKHEGSAPLPEAQATYQVWNLDDAALLVEFTFPLACDPRWGAISPGGKYLVMQQTSEGYHILLWDLTTGKLAGMFDFQQKDDEWGQAAGLSFTPRRREAGNVVGAQQKARPLRPAPLLGCRCRQKAARFPDRV